MRLGCEAIQVLDKLPWVAEVFSRLLRSSSAEMFRGRPYWLIFAEGRSHERRSAWITVKTWQKPETAYEKSLSPRESTNGYQLWNLGSWAFIYRIKSNVQCLYQWITTIVTLKDFRSSDSTIRKTLYNVLNRTSGKYDSKVHRSKVIFKWEMHHDYCILMHFLCE